jgi:hypothetical protein
MRPVREGERHPLSWQELLFRRLTGRWGIPSGATTLDAERLLDFPVPMTYFFVGRCVPSFGSNTIASGLHAQMVCDGPFTSPFDTGALAKGDKIAVSPALDPANSGEFVKNHTYVGREYVDPMSAWLTAAFESPTGYAEGKTPTVHAVPEVNLGDCGGDARVWTWEGRIPAKDYVESPVDVRQVFFSEGTREPYLDWVRGTELVTKREGLQHMRDVYAYSEELGDAATGMLDFLRGELTT